MMTVNGVPLIGRLLCQLKGSNLLDEVIVATSHEKKDDLVEAYVHKQGYRVVRGSQDDVLSRYTTAADLGNADIVVRLTGDCPLHSADTVDEVIASFLDADVDYATNTDPYTRPDGQDVEVFKRIVLNYAAADATEPADREHVTLWIKRNPQLKKINVSHKLPHCGTLRWSVDHPDDLEFVRAVWAHLDGCGNKPFNFEEIMTAVLKIGATPGKAIINEGYYLSILKAANSEKASELELGKSFELLERADKVVPGSAQTYSKSWRHHIKGVTPIFLEKGKGAWVTDVDGNKYVDLIQGLLPNILGYGNEEVDRAVFEQAQRGHSFSLPHAIEVELAERLCRLIPCAEMVRYGKNGSDATAGAVRVARAFTGRDHVACCGYHGWQDWYIGTTSRSAGVPTAVRELTHPFPYNDPEALDAILARRLGEFAAVIMEPVNFEPPAPGYLETVKKIAHKHGALLIFDEICSGFHFGLGGAQKIYGVTPDLATFGKAMGNGWPVSCVVGRKDVMQVFEDAFFSFTFGGDLSSIAAAKKVLDILEGGDAYQRMTSAGTKLFDGARVMAEAVGLGDIFRLRGHPHWAHFAFVDERGNDDAAIRALWVQEVTRRNVLILTTFNICAALDEVATKTVLDAFANAFKRVALAREKGVDPLDWLDGPMPIPAFRPRG